MENLQNEGGMEISTLKEAFSWFAELSKELLILLDSKGRIKYINATLEKALQYDLSEVAGMNYLELVHEDDRNKSNELFCAVQNNQFSPPYTNRYCRKDGTYISLLWRHAKATKEGWVQGMGQLVKESSDNLGDSIANSVGLSHFFDLMDDASAICDMEGRMLLVNSAFEHLYKWKKQELLGEFCPTIPKHLYHEVDYIQTEIWNGKKIIHLQTFRMKKDGSIIPVSLIIAPILDGDGTVIAVSVITKDLTELMETTMMIEQQNDLITCQERLILDITENINEVITLFDMMQCKFLYVSPSFERLWGISSEELCENPYVMKDQFYQEDLEKLIKVYAAPFDDVPLELECKLKDDSGIEDRWIRIKVTPLADENGQITRNIGIAQDITEWKKQDEALKKQDKLGALGQLAAGIAHEIRNPLTTVKGLIQLLAQESNDNNFYNKIILKELDQVESIVTEFLMLANPYEEIKFAHHNINEVLTEIIQFMWPEALLHKVEMNTTLGDSLPLVYCEPKQIKQVMINVFKNAIEAMPSGGSMYITTSLLLDGSVAIEVRDEGRGIPKEMIGRLGEPFYSNKERGTGLGLMVSYKIIENHRGTIQIDSDNGNGTNIKIILPPELQ
ncbi:MULTISPECIES: PAS domain-containing sensor histidine kinase [Bacillaceae]|uniref:histidine kinase n=1 Tax=Domibacillus aminovorans TaxID=29332 RepID=A0A177KRI2_9BACI|nr:MULTISPECIES: PAS domain-containing sensor histidine kinase [Bacillaceae]OAH55953.1 hypothetical protein AWH48_04575 [Domibacillus aminovorans]